MRPTSTVQAAFLAAALAAAILPAAARAEPPAKQPGSAPDVSDEDRAAARRHFLRGKELHAAGRYHEAAAEYAEAYHRFPAPAFLYNMAQVYRLAGDRKAAIQYYRMYLELAPDGEGSADAREFLAALEAVEAAQQKAGSEFAPVPVPTGSKAALAADPTVPIQAGRPQADRDRSSPGSGKKIVGLSFCAAGMVGLGVAVGFGLEASSIADDLSNYEGQWTEMQDARYEEGQEAERIMKVSAAVGLAALTTGAIVYYLGDREAARDATGRLELGATGKDDGAFFFVRGAF